MNQPATNYVTLLTTLLGAIKLTLETFGYHVITNDQINAAANLLAAVLTVAGIFMTHQSKGDDAQ